MTHLETNESAESIAIIGMSGRFPGASNLETFWQNLQDGVESISFFSDEELSMFVDASVLGHPNVVKAAGVIKGIDLFDASFFGYSPREAEIMDPQHRLFLECAWETLENAGYNPETCKGLIGLFAGAAMSTYLFHLYSNPSQLGTVDAFQLNIGNDKDHLCTRVSYKLNLKGPSVTVQTTCSTSLVAVCLACQSLLNYQCDMALAGGVSLSVPQERGYVYQDGGIFSPDGHCRAFDARGQGFVAGSGLGIVALKRLEDAVADRDNIRAIIRGSALNNDGSLKAGYTAPSVDGQAQVIAMAQAMAQINPEAISYIEAHGTATPLGDPIEIAALTHVFRAATRKKNFCAIGSVKTNIGHLDPAAGIAGLIKTVLSLEHRMLPPSLHFHQANPKIDFANSPFYVNSSLREWKSNGTPRRAGVSSFGIGGTNAHVVLEEAPARSRSASSKPCQLLVLSAKTESALELATDNLVKHLKQHPGQSLADVAYVCHVGRKPFNHRRMLVCKNGDLEATIEVLERRDPLRVVSLRQAPSNLSVVFMFSGQGTQHLHMARELYETEPGFRENVDFCSQMLRAHLGLDLRAVLYPTPQNEEEAAKKLNETSLAQPALFVIEYALAKLWMLWGVRPQAMVGHSLGEYVAACLAGVLTLEDALKVVAIRGRLMGQMPAGGMIAVSLSERELQPLVNGAVSLAAVNGTSLCVVSGPEEHLGRLSAEFTQRGLGWKRLVTSHAFHSAMMEPIQGSFLDLMRSVRLEPPKIQYLSNFTGTWITGAEACDPHYWARHLRGTVRFADNLQQVLKDSGCVLVEIGPGQTLCSLTKQHPDHAKVRQVVLPSLPGPQEKQSDAAVLMNALGRLWLSGITVDWAGFYSHEARQRIPLPTYPFERHRYWIEPAQATAPVGTTDLLPKRPDIADWFYVPSWRMSSSPALYWQRELKTYPARWLVFTHPDELSSRLVDLLRREGQAVTTVSVGESFGKLDDQSYAVNVRSADDYKALFGELLAQGKAPQIVVHLWSAGFGGPTAMSATESFEHLQDLGFFSLLFLAQAMVHRNFTDAVQLSVVSSQMQAVTGQERLCPAKATLLGPCKVIPQEHPNIVCRSIDLVLPEPNSPDWDPLIEQLVAEIGAGQFDPVVAYRGNRRCIQDFEPVRLAPSGPKPGRLRENGVYLITGGFTGIGLTLAEYLARSVKAKLVLTGRSRLPDREHWTGWLAEHGQQDPVSRKILQLQALEQRGAEVMTLSADVAELDQMREVIKQTLERFGALHGVVHSAGIAAGGLVQLKAQGEAQRVFSPKVKGVLVLEELLKDIPLDFFTTCSSLASIVGGFGQVDYCAANNFLDAFAHSKAWNGTHTTSINWDTWQETGMAVNTPVPPELEAWRQESLSKGITCEEGINVFARILSTTLPQVAVSTKELSAMAGYLALETALASSPTQEMEVGEAGSVSHHSRPMLACEYVAPRNEVEQVIATTWGELLGIKQVGIHDSFFELGGHSLLAIQLNSRLRDAFKVELSLQDFFAAPTVAELAETVEKAKEKVQQDLESIQRLLEQVELLSEEQVKSLLAEPSLSKLKEKRDE